MDDSLVAVATHQMRGSLAAILGSARTLEHHDEQLVAEQRADLVARISGEAMRLARLADNLLAASRLPASQPTHAPVAAVARQAISEATSRHERRRVRSRVPADLYARIGVEALHAVLVNLLRNALRFAASGSRVDLVGSARDDRVVLEVSNAGPPIEPADHARVFKPFVAGVTGDDPQPGFGLGLYVVRTLVKAYAGAVQVTSEDGVVRFSVALPATTADVIDLTEAGSPAGKKKTANL